MSGIVTIAQNPVIRGKAPDPSLIRVDDWYYVATGSTGSGGAIPQRSSK